MAKKYENIFNFTSVQSKSVKHKFIVSKNKIIIKNKSIKFDVKQIKDK